MDQEPIHDRIHGRRKAFGAQAAEMAHWAGLPRERWEAIEAGSTAITFSELGRVAQALAVDPGALLRGEEDNPRRSVARFRGAVVPEALSPKLLRTLALAAEFGRMMGGLQRALGSSMRIAENRQATPVSETPEPWKQGYELGARARDGLGIAAGPILTLQASLESLGVHIAFVDLGDPEIDAASLMEAEAMPIVLLNTRSSRVQSPLPRRAAMAHEVCHLLYDSGEDDLVTLVSLDEKDLHGGAIEQRARAFAPAFIAPPEEVQEYFRRGGGSSVTRPDEKVRTLAERWGLSWRGAVWHAKNCRLIVASTAKDLIEMPAPSLEWADRFEAPGDEAQEGEGKKAAPTDLVRGAGARLVRQALSAGLISEGRALEILAWG